SLISTLSTSDHLSSKPPAVHLISPTNLKVACGAMVNQNQASSLEDSHNNCQSAIRSSKQDSSPYFQSASHSSAPSMSKISSCASNICYSSPQLYDNLQTPSLHSPVCVCKMGDFTTSSIPPLSPSSSKRLKALSPLPVCITTHSLSPSPKPLSPPSLYGSSSTVCSVNEPCTQMSSRGYLVKSGVRSPLPTRLTLLTAILRSGSSQRRPLSPASCPTFSPSSLCSSTLAIDQKCKMTPPTRRKSISSPPVRPDSPSREEHWPSGWAQHVSLSPRKHLPVRTPSPDSRSPQSPPISSHRKSTASPGWQSTLPALAVPPSAPAHYSLAHPTSPPPEGLRYPASRSQGPQRCQRVHTYSPIFTCQSYPLLSPTRLSGTFSPTREKLLSPSPSLSTSTSRSKSDSSQKSAQELSTPSPTSSGVSKQWSLSRPDSTSPVPQTCNINSHPLQLHSSLMHRSYRSNSQSPRPEQSATSPVLKCRSPVSDKSPCTLPSRPRELTSPQSFSLPSDHENIKPKQYKIKTSYKAFAAIPTNTLLMEQKVSMCSPAQLRQQTEELCAVIDQVLQDPLTMVIHQYVGLTFSSSFIFVSSTLQRAAGRETRYVSTFIITLYLTKPGVIRPVLVKAKSAQQKEEPYQPNPFKRYLEEISDQDIEGKSAPPETVLLHPLYPTKPIPPNKSPLHPLRVSLADCLNPGPFSHLSSIMCDVHENPYSPYCHNSLYNKVSVKCGVTQEYCQPFIPLNLGRI
uniref:Muscular LMNA interacting protein n=1 Tax=Anser cygnoides TaxID=8845 RepID=A0A8B9IKA7_ANSCY